MAEVESWGDNVLNMMLQNIVPARNTHNKISNHYNTNMSLGLSWPTCSGKFIILKFLLLGTDKQRHLSGNKSFFSTLHCTSHASAPLQTILR